MRVGIVTWYGVTNYGSALQAYALQQLIRETGRESVILRHPVHERNPRDPRRRGAQRLDPRAWNPRRVRSIRGEERKALAIAQFRAESLSVSGSYLEDTPVDLALIGSDQIFDVRNFHAFQFGHGVKASEVSTYAPSFGETTWESLKVSPDYETVAAGVNKMRQLSGRDENTVQILSRLTGRDVVKTLDPTLAYDFATEREAWGGPLVEGRYVAIYSWGGTTTSKVFADSVRAFAKRHGLKTVSIGDTRPWCDVDFASASPQEFFSLISNAEVLVTNMFHGTCFALLTGVPVLPLVMPHNANKLGGLLRQLSLSEHALRDLSGIASIDIPEIDYLVVGQKLGAERDRSLGFLRDALEVAA